MQCTSKSDMGEYLQNGLDKVKEMMTIQSDNQLFILAISGAVSAVTLQSVERFTKILFDWGNTAKGLSWLRQGMKVNVLGAPLDLGQMAGVVVYIIVALFFLALVVFGILKPLLSKDVEETVERNAKNAGSEVPALSRNA